MSGPLQVDFGALASIRGKLLPLILDVLRTTDLDPNAWSRETGD